MKFANWYLLEIDDGGGYRLRAYKYEFVGKLFFKFSAARCKIYTNGDTEIIRNIIKNNE